MANPSGNRIRLKLTTSGVAMQTPKGKLDFTKTANSNLVGAIS